MAERGMPLPGAGGRVETCGRPATEVTGVALGAEAGPGGADRCAAATAAALMLALAAWLPAAPAPAAVAAAPRGRSWPSWTADRARGEEPSRDPLSACRQHKRSMGHRHVTHSAWPARLPRHARSCSHRTGTSWLLVTRGSPGSWTWVHHWLPRWSPDCDPPCQPGCQLWTAGLRRPPGQRAAAAC